MRKLSITRILLLTLGGALGGLCTWLFLNPGLRDSEFHASAGSAYTLLALLGLVMGSAVGGFLVLADEVLTRSLSRITLRVVVGAFAGAVCGLVSWIAGQLIYSMLMSVVRIVQLVGGEAARSLEVIARTIGWALVGLGIGSCLGLVSRSFRQAKQGMLGGLLGGALGGFVFDFLVSLTSGPMGHGDASFSRLVGFVCIGAGIGFAVSLIEEAAKNAWVTVLTGAKEGRSFIISKDKTTVGRSEMADIPLFGDPSVNGTHALFVKSGPTYSISAVSGADVLVNSQNVASAGLGDGSIIGIGRHRLRFNTTGRAGISTNPISPLPDPGQQRTQQPLMPSVPPGSQLSMPASVLQVVAGPHAGESFALGQGERMVVGRDPASDIALSRDEMVSRRHAVLIRSGSDWRIEDTASTNGVYVNSVRVTSEVLRPGAMIHIGQTDLRVV